ncbi:hypothetical protein RJ639_010191 [Escallonia herrerae]|uniref:Uncharacterized protein n=1 Tax=Escallonia herrerae TaxID=1293975 RepID=A0AA89ATL0_9ASTE|nr:hypothetical protein RJ639_010191 [Escallonia herrerae]
MRDLRSWIFSSSRDVKRVSAQEGKGGGYGRSRGGGRGRGMCQHSDDSGGDGGFSIIKASGCIYIFGLVADDCVPSRCVFIELTDDALIFTNLLNGTWVDKCSRSDIAIYQSPTTPLPSGIPTYTVEIVNECVNGCEIFGIHFSCGWFSSARLINPRIFKRLRYDDCVVNDGKPLVNGRILSFQYANTFPYPLSVSSVIC